MQSVATILGGWLCGCTFLGLSQLRPTLSLQWEANYLLRCCSSKQSYIGKGSNRTAIVWGGSLDVMGSSTSQGDFDYLFKLLLIGDSGVGKSSLLLRFTSDEFDEISPTVGVDFKLKFMTVGGKRLKLTIWDTAGQERFRTLTSSYYRGAQGIILVYDVTRRETFTNLSDVWLKEVELYSTNQDCIKLLVGNKVDRDSERVVSKQEGIAFARQNGCLFLECSAKTRVNVENCFEELVLKILDTPSLLADSTSGARKNIFKQEQGIDGNSGSCC